MNFLPPSPDPPRSFPSRLVCGCQEYSVEMRETLIYQKDKHVCIFWDFYLRELILQLDTYRSQKSSYPLSPHPVVLPPIFCPRPPSPPAQHRSLRPSCRPPNGLGWGGGAPYPFFAFLPSSLSLFLPSPRPSLPIILQPGNSPSLKEEAVGWDIRVCGGNLAHTYLFPFGLGEERPQEPQRHKNVSSFWS